MTAIAPDFIEVFSGTWWSAGLVKSMLEDAGLEVFMKDEIRGATSLSGFHPGSGGVKLMIPRNQFSEAKAVMDEYYSNQNKPIEDFPDDDG
jgi:hypothetical protein